MSLFARERVRPRTPDQLRAMRVAGLLVGQTLEMLRAQVRAGVTTGQLDALAEDFIRSGGGIPNFQLVPGYVNTLCTSVNDEIVHGIPGDRVLRDGDLLSIDCGAEVDGWNGDSAITLVVGGDEAGDPAAVRLSEITRRSLWAGLAALRPGGDLNDIGGAVEDSIRADARADGVAYGIVEDYTGHGIGEHMHLPPNVPNYRVRGRVPQTPTGATLAIEPMVTLGDQANHVLDDDWTVVTDDGAPAAHWEHSVALTEHGIWVLTALDGGEAELTARGAPFGPLV
ncbi:type I methionyl aminopeptidase [Janibacter limosus]|uniref:Methionine aminopeptidase n=1 Tax=Janibacter limosus TaxID=53458 RepID=A0A4P6MT23_9MICO|nr:type I methionyl aminopeptidase [Janibacter limosus]QBF46901.1 type I methionyl aminopeptidase [Janibacter limosus]